MSYAIRSFVVVAVAGLILAPATARAEGYFSPFVGVNAANQPVEGRTNFGFSAGGMGGGVIGGEFDFGYAPDVFDESFDNHALTAMGNLIVGIPVGGTLGPGVRPYLTGGLGLIHTAADNVFGDNESTNDLGFNVGAGLMGFFSDHFGLRGDARYFRNVTSDLRDSDLDPEFRVGNLDFWRASVGIVIR
jgi:opacity protein-like surface antigen